MSSSDKEEILLLLALSCKRKGRHLLMWSISSDISLHASAFFIRFLYSGWPVCSKTTHSRTFSISFFSEFFRHSVLPAWQICLQNTNVRCPPYLHWSAASARLLFEGDDAVLHNTVRTPSRRGHRSLLSAAARFLYGRTFRCSEQTGSVSLSQPCWWRFKCSKTWRDADW